MQVFVMTRLSLARIRNENDRTNVVAKSPGAERSKSIVFEMKKSKWLKLFLMQFGPFAKRGYYLHF